MTDRSNISPGKKDDSQLMDYINNKLSGQEKHDFEVKMAESELLNDAAEGLGEVKDKEKLLKFADKLNADLLLKLANKKQHRQKLKIPVQSWIYFTIVLILVLIIVSFFLIKKHLGQ